MERKAAKRAAMAAIVWGLGCAGGGGDYGGVPNVGLSGQPGTTGEMASSGEAGEPEDDDGPDGPSSVSESATEDPTTGSGSIATDGATTGPATACTRAEDCLDADPCTEDHCIDGECSSEPLPCDDGIDCTADGCDAGLCTHETQDAMCDDGDACTGMETCSMESGCVAGTPVSCTDGEACTEDICNPATGACEYPAVDMCSNGDGCCPGGCSVAADDDCVCTNLAPSASTSSNGGGLDSAGYGPSNWTDGVDEAGCIAAGCLQCYGWIDNDAGVNGAFMQLTWPADVTIGSMYVDANVAAPPCGSANRNMASGTVQSWNGAAWVDEASWFNQAGDLSFDFNPPLQTSRVRLMDVQPPAGGINTLAFEWYVYEPLGCTP